jgi:hypothetical protein
MKLGRHKAMDRSVADRYRRVAASLLDSARTLAEITDEDDHTGNAIAIVAVHAAISWADAVCIAYSGMKSTDGDHTRAADLLQDALGTRADAQALRSLRAVLQKKDMVAYGGAYYRVCEGRTLLGYVETFSGWAERTYELRPRR